MQYKGVIFDMDGLLFDTEQVYQKNWTRLAEEMHINLPDAFRTSICGTSGELMDHLIEKYYHVENGRPYAEKVMTWAAEDLKSYVPEKKGLHEILAFFKERHFKMAIASSSRKAQIENNLHLSHIENEFDALVSGRDDGIRNGKPAPDIFLKAAEKIGLKASECYVFEDAYNGIRAAAAAGARPIMIPDMIPADDEMRHLAWRIYPDLIAARDDLENMDTVFWEGKK